MASPDSINADIVKLVSANWNDICADLSANPKKASTFAIQVSLNQSADGSLSYSIRQSFKKQAVVSTASVAAAQGKIS
jgi:hypothetical protein